MGSCVVGLAAQQPQFKTAVERILVDVQVVDPQGRPISSLTADDFEVRFDQGIRRVASVEFVRDAAIETLAAGGSGIADAVAIARDRLSGMFAEVGGVGS